VLTPTLGILPNDSLPEWRFATDPNQPITNVQTLDEIVAHGTEARRVRTILMTAFAGSTHLQRA
jgi:hypothetical protein